MNVLVVHDYNLRKAIYFVVSSCDAVAVFRLQETGYRLILRGSRRVTEGFEIQRREERRLENGRGFCGLPKAGKAFRKRETIYV